MDCRGGWREKEGWCRGDEDKTEGPERGGGVEKGHGGLDES